MAITPPPATAADPRSAGGGARAGTERSGARRAKGSTARTHANRRAEWGVVSVGPVRYYTYLLTWSGAVEALVWWRGTEVYFGSTICTFYLEKLPMCYELNVSEV